MNPLFAALNGPQNAQNAAGGSIPIQAANGPLGAFQSVLQRARQIAGSIQNPQQLVSQYFPDAPEEMRGDPNQLLGWLQQTGKVNPQMVQTARQMLGM